MLFVFCELWGAVGPVGERRCVEQPILLLTGRLKSNGTNQDADDVES